MKVACGAAFIFLLILFLTVFETEPYAFWGYLVFIVAGLLILAGLFYGLTYNMYTVGRKAFLEVADEDVQIITNIRVYIKGFDLLSKKSFYNIGTNTTIYSFNNADVIFAEESMILLGKSKQFGAEFFAAPVEIATSHAKTSIAFAMLMNWEENGDKLQIEIEDEYYTKPVKIEFKNYKDEVKQWLTRFPQKKKVMS